MGCISGGPLTNFTYVSYRVWAFFATSRIYMENLRKTIDIK
jgi:hypothetical protein